MSKLENMNKPLIWSAALLLTAVVAGCGGGSGGSPGTAGGAGTPGTNPAVVNLLSSSMYALTSSAGLTTSGVATFGGNAALDAPTGACTATPAAPTGATTDTCGLSTGVDVTNAAVNTSGSLAITGTTIRYNPGTTPNSSGFNATVRAVKTDVNTAWNDAFNRTGGTPIVGPGALGGLTLTQGVYTSASTMTLGSGETLTLDAAGNANAVWIFKVGSDLTITGSTVACTGTAPNQVCTPTQVKLINGALAKNVFWEVGTPTTAAANGTASFPAATGPVQNNTIFKGTILAGNSVTFAGGTAVEGRVLAGANLLGTPNTQTGGAVSATAGSTGAVAITLPQ